MRAPTFPETQGSRLGAQQAADREQGLSARARFWVDEVTRPCSVGRVAALTDLDMVVTDDGLPDEVRQAFEAAGPPVHIKMKASRDSSADGPIRART